MREETADIEFGTPRHLEIDRDERRLRHTGAFAGNERHAMAGRGKASSQIEHHPLRAAVGRGGEPVPEKEGDVHLAFQSTHDLVHLLRR